MIGTSASFVSIAIGKVANAMMIARIIQEINPKERPKNIFINAITTKAMNGKSSIFFTLLNYSLL